jgi:hypothetical protein
MASAGRISINLTAGNAQLILGLDAAKARLEQVANSARSTGAALGSIGGHGSITGVQATSAALRTLEGGITNNLRAAERFIATTAGFGDALKSIFPVVGAIAFGGVLFELGEKAQKVYEYFVKLAEAPRRIAQEFAALAGPIQVSNDQLAVANDKLAIEIAKLERKPVNNLKLGLDEARLAADQFAESLNRDLEQMQKLMESEGIGKIAGFLTGNASTTDITKQFKQFREGLTDISQQTTDKLSQTNDPKKQAAIYAEATNQRKASIDSETKLLKDQLAVAQSLTAAKALALAPFGPGTGVTAAQHRQAVEANPAGIRDQSRTISELKGTINELQKLSLIPGLRDANAALTTQRDGLVKAPKPEAPKPEDFFGAEMSRLTGQLSAARAEAAAANGPKDEVKQAQAKGYGQAAEAIARINEQLTKANRATLTLSQQSDIIAKSAQVALTQAGGRISSEQAKSYEEGLSGAQKISEMLDEQNAKHQEQLKLINDETDAARSLAAAYGQGYEAVSKAQLAIKLAGIKGDGPQFDEAANLGGIPNGGQLKQAEEGKFKAQQNQAISETVAQLTRETDATLRLAAAQNLGRDAQRAAELKNISNSGQSSDVIAAQTSLKQAQFGQEDAASGRGLSAAGGYKKFFQDLNDNTQSAGQMVQTVLGGAFNSLNSSMEALISGQKVSWSSLFRGLAAQIAGLGLNKIEGSLFGAIGSGLGGLGGGGNGDFGGETGGGGGFFASLFGGFRAGGGPTDSGKAYVVGENGPEIFTPGSGGGSIIPNRAVASGSGGGTHVSYSIDARGADAASIEQRVNRSLVAVHGQAVRSSVQTQTELAKRRPR